MVKSLVLFYFIFELAATVCSLGKIKGRYHGLIYCRYTIHRCDLQDLHGPCLRCCVESKGQLLSIP